MSLAILLPLAWWLDLPIAGWPALALAAGVGAVAFATGRSRRRSIDRSSSPPWDRSPGDDEAADRDTDPAPTRP